MLTDKNLPYPKRKPHRLKNYDYSQSGVYFITICTKDKENVFWDVGATIGRPYNNFTLSKAGKIVECAILNIPKTYSSVTLEKYVIMPNHTHLLLHLHSESGRAMHAPTVSTVIQQMKGYTTKQIGFNIWQKLFHDHVVRNAKSYKKIWQYIEDNPAKWEEDCFYN
ncbi:MAG: transposase [Ruminococcaceae bacterium]|nr:transposase [Oscillospiraceae bacterium]